LGGSAFNQNRGDQNGVPQFHSQFTFLFKYQEQINANGLNVQ